MQETALARSPEAEPRWAVIWRRADVWWALGGLLLGFVGVGIVVFTTLGRDDASLNMPTVVATVAYEAWIGVIVLLLARRRGISMRALGYVWPRQWRWIPFAVLATYASVIGYFIVIAIIEAFGPNLEGLRQGNSIPESDEYSFALYAVLGVGVVVAAPLSEELFFRGLVFRQLAGDGARWRSSALAMVISGFAFSLFHLNPSVVIPFAFVGMAFAYAFREARSLWTPTAAHAIFNLISFVTTLIAT